MLPRVLLPIANLALLAIALGQPALAQHDAAQAKTENSGADAHVDPEGFPLPQAIARVV